MKKRVLSLALALCLCLGLFVVPAGAYDMGKEGELNTISVGGEHAAVIDENNALWMWGWNNYGQIGFGSEESYSSPVKVMDNVMSVSCGNWSTAAIRTDGSLWIWGQSASRGVGNTEKNGRFWQTVPMKILDDVVAVNCSGDSCAAVKKDGSLWAWGDIWESRYGETGEKFQTPAKIMDDVAAFSSGAIPAVLAKDGSLWVWPYIPAEQYGIYKAEGKPIIEKVLDNVTAFSCGTMGIAAIQTDGSLWVWGSNRFGELGTGETTTQETIKFVKVMDGVVSVSVGNGYTTAVRSDGSLWAWGINMWGNLGNGRVGNHTVETSRSDWGPYLVQTTPVKIMENVAQVRAGGENETMYTLIAKNDGSLWFSGICVQGSVGSVVSGNQILDLDYFGGEFSIQTVPALVPGISVAPTATPSTQTVNVDGKNVEFAMYALEGGAVNYIRVRDLAAILNGTKAQFEVGWDGNVTLTSKTPYTGATDKAPFTWNMPYTDYTAPTYVDGKATHMEAIQIEYNGGGFTYYKLRDLGQALGFNVGWSADRGVYVETNKPYDPND